MNALAFRELHTSPAHKLPLFGVNLSTIIAAMSPSSGNTVTGGLEHRGLHWTDKRFSLLTGIPFVKGIPTCSFFQIMSRTKEANQAVAGRKHATKKITGTEYVRSLMIRNIRGQILNPVLRVDLATRLLEKLRRNSLTNKFVRFAMKPNNAQTAATLLLFN
jgi:hypothetical protein